MGEAALEAGCGGPKGGLRAGELRVRPSRTLPQGITNSVVVVDDDGAGAGGGGSVCSLVVNEMMLVLIGYYSSSVRGSGDDIYIGMR